MFNNQLKFHTHTTLVASKVNRILAVINQCYDTLESKSFVTLYKTLVHPILEYGNVIYGPHYQLGDINILESVQRRATKLIHNFILYPMLKDCITWDCLP